MDDLRVKTLSASIGALLTSVAVTPLDVIKVRLQGEKSTLSTASGTFLRILRTEGWMSLYRGFIPTVAMSLPGTVIYFVGYEKIRDKLNSDNTIVRRELVPLISGAFARILSTAAVSPLELIRTRMQFKGIESGKLKPVVFELTNSIKSEGFKVMWRGLQPTLWRDVPFSAIYWTILESIKSSLITNNDLSLENTLITFGSGAVSGAIAAAITTPFDVAKTRQQLILNKSKDPIKLGGCPSTTWIQLKDIWREAGWRGLTRGMGPRIAKVAPACAIMIGSYELGKMILSY